MEILVNEQPVDVQLEGERTLGEVIKGLRGWLQETNLYITDLSVNKTEHHLDNESDWSTRAVDDITSIEIVAMPPWEVRLNGYRILHNYVHTLADALEHEGSREAPELLNEYPYVRKHLDEVIAAVFGPGKDTSLDQAIQHAQNVQSGEEAAEAVSALRHASTLLNDRIRELATPFHEARRTRHALESVVAEVEEVSVLLQTGEEQKAMSLIIRFSELVERFLRILSAINSRYGTDHLHTDLDSTALREQTDTLRSTLEELVTAFKEQDTVLIGDLLEYDMLPQVRQLFSLVPDEHVQ